MAAQPEADDVQTIELDKNHELRLEVDAKSVVSITLKRGAAEVFGTDLLVGERVQLQGHKLAVFTWTGCSLEVQGTPAVMYESDETPMRQFLNTHTALDERRAAARSSGSQGPRCMVVGPTDVGKSSLCKILLNYAVRMGWCPTYVDLDIGQGSVTCPGSVAATPVESPIDIVEGLMGSDMPLAYYFGHLTPSDNPALYRHAVEQLAALLEQRCTAGSAPAASGMVVNTMGWVEGLGYELLLHAAQTLRVDVVLVVGQDRLYSQLSASLGSAGVTLAKLPKSGGVVTRDPVFRKDARTARVREYFEGPFGELTFHSSSLPMSQLHVYRLSKGDKTPTTALPVGASSMRDPLQVLPMQIGMDLIHTVCAVSHAKTPDQLLSSNVAGFVYVEDVDVTKGTVTFRTPAPGPLPGLYWLAGSIKVILS